MSTSRTSYSQTPQTKSKMIAKTDRSASLLKAQQMAHDLFDSIEQTIIRPGVTEKQLSDEIHALGSSRHNVRTHWHKRLVRSGPNTLFPYAANPPDRVVQDDDILFVDLGPVFEEWEADFGRTFVLGDDPVKLRLRDCLEPVWNEVRKAYWEKADGMTGQELYAVACEAARREGWVFGGPHAGHLIGDFPHERIPNDKVTLYITEGNGMAMSERNKEGERRHWILEIHLVDREREIGGFFEQLLTVGADGSTPWSTA
jgi:Xaa-Pro aminopeptidase